MSAPSDSDAAHDAGGSQSTPGGAGSPASLLMGTIATGVAVVAAIVIALVFTPRPDDATIEAARELLTQSNVDQADAVAQPFASPSPVAGAGAGAGAAQEPSADVAFDDQQLLAEFAALVEPLGYVDDGTLNGGAFDICGGPATPNVTTYFYVSGATDLVITPYRTPDQAQDSLNQMTGISTPCDAVPDLFVNSVQQRDPSTIDIVLGYEGDPVTYYEVYVRRANAIVGVLSDDSTKIEQFEALYKQWDPGTLAVAGVSGAAAVAPTAVPPAIATATPRPEPTPTPTPEPLPTPVPTTAPSDASIQRLPAGIVSVPVGPGISFELRSPQDSIHLPGISALYVNDSQTSEVDIFVPAATASGLRLVTFEDVVRFVNIDPLFAGLEQFPGNRFGQVRAIGFRGTGPQLEQGFFTDPFDIGNLDRGWRMPGQLEMWIVDTGSGPIVITAEALASAAPQDFERARELMVHTIETMQFRTG